jgi:hypothetical protein
MVSDWLAGLIKGYCQTQPLKAERFKPSQSTSNNFGRLDMSITNGTLNENAVYVTKNLPPVYCCLCSNFQKILESY